MGRRLSIATFRNNCIFLPWVHSVLEVCVSRRQNVKNTVDRHPFFVLSGAPSFTYPRMVPLEDETHGGEDVMVFARGPWAHLFTGNYEQNVVPLTMGFAAGVGPAAGLAGAPAPYRAAVSIVRPPSAAAVLVAATAALALRR